MSSYKAPQGAHEACSMDRFLRAGAVPKASIAFACRRATPSPVHPTDAPASYRTRAAPFFRPLGHSRTPGRGVSLLHGLMLIVYGSHPPPVLAVLCPEWSPWASRQTAGGEPATGSNGTLQYCQLRPDR